MFILISCTLSTFTLWIYIKRNKLLLCLTERFSIDRDVFRFDISLQLIDNDWYSMTLNIRSCNPSTLSIQAWLAESINKSLYSRCGLIITLYSNNDVSNKIHLRILHEIPSFCLSFLRIDKGSRAVSHVSGCSGGTISSTVTIYIPYERSYFSSSYDIKYIIFWLELWQLQI